MNFNWEFEVPDPRNGNVVFTPDGEHAVFLNSHDSLCIVLLGSSKVKYIPDVSSFEINKISGQWLTYICNDQAKTFVIQNLKTGIRKSYSGVVGSDFAFGDKVLFLRTVSKDSSKIIETLKWINLINWRSILIWEGAPITSLLFDQNHRQLMLRTINSIWHYKENMSKINCLIDKVDSATEKGRKFGYFTNFSKDGNRVFMTLESNPQTDLNLNGLEVWSYNDPKLQSEQEKGFGIKYYAAVFDIKSRKIINLQKEDELFSLPTYEGSPDTVGFIQHRPGGSPLEGEWNIMSEAFNYFISTKTGERRKLKCTVGTSMSPKGKFLIYFDSKTKNYFSYELLTSISRNISSSLNVSWLGKDRDDLRLDGSGGERGVATWLEEDKAVLIYDRYDIWQLDPLGVEKPVNITNGYGLKHHIVFYLGLNNYLSNPIRSNERLILNSFNTTNKYNGFFSKSLNKVGDPEYLTMGPYIYQLINNSYIRDPYSYPTKAKHADVYLLRRMNATEFPNYYITRDFKEFIKVTNLCPEKDWNWYTTELHSWKSLNGKNLQGILYKPENFDMNKQYPVIFHYYERKSDAAYAYLVPEFSSGVIDIPTYVSNGYLVFCPDVYYTIGDPMQGTYDAVVSAANYLSKFRFVNPKKMAIQGHSFGGLQTNYLITHSDLFAAACSTSGLSDLISGYGTLYGNSNEGYSYSLQHVYESGQIRMGTILWDNLGGYMKNSAILQAPKIRTPLLLMHTKKDKICSYSNILEFFLALRRLGKVAWMLVYPEGMHSLHGREARDFTIRMQQFFDYYLKDKPAPVWMLDGIPAKDRRIRSGLELDTNGRRPGRGLLTIDEQKKVDSLPIPYSTNFLK